MKLKVSKESLFEALSIASRFTTSRAHLPILGNILLEAKENKLNISATNLETSVSLSIAAKIEKEGKITIPSKIIYEVVSNLGSESLELEVEKEQILLKNENFSSKISGINASDFPTVPNSIGRRAQNIDSSLVTLSLPKVLYSVSSDETRPTLTGVLLIFAKGKLAFVATDGFRLSKKVVTLKNINVKEDMKIILPKAVMAELGRLIKEEKISFEYKKDDKQIVFKIGDIYLSSRVIEGDFPDFEKIIPGYSKLSVELDKNDFLQGVKLASVFARDSSNVVKFQIKENSFTLAAESSQSGSQENKVDAKITFEEKDVLDEKKEFIIAFNCKFVEEFLNSVEGSSVEVKFNDSNSPGVFLDAEDKDLLHLIMPVRI